MIYRKAFCQNAVLLALTLAFTPAYAQQADGDIERKYSALAMQLEALQTEMEALQARQGEIIQRMQEIRTEHGKLGRQLSRSTAKPSAAGTAPAPAPKAKATTEKSSASATAKSGQGLVSVRYVFEDAASARTALENLKSRGIDAYLAKGDGSYRVYAGAYNDERIAMEKARSFGSLQGVQPDIFLSD